MIPQYCHHTKYIFFYFSYKNIKFQQSIKNWYIMGTKNYLRII